MNMLDKLWQVIDRHAVVADMCCDDIRRQRDQCVIVPLIFHCMNPEQKNRNRTRIRRRNFIPNTTRILLVQAAIMLAKIKETKLFNPSAEA